MHWSMILLIGLASNIDNFAVGLTYGLQEKKITETANAFIAAVGLITSFLMILVGKFLGYSIPEPIAGFCGGAIILLIGLWTFVETYRHRKQSSKTIPEASKIDKDQNNIIAFNEVFWLSFALSLNAMGTSFGAGVGRMDPIMVSLSVSIFSFISIGAGQLLGLKGLHSRLGKISEYAASLMLIGIGIYEILSSSM